MREHRTKWLGSQAYNSLKLQTWRLVEERKWVKEFMTYTMHFFIDQKNQQLKARIRQIGNELFEDQDFFTGNIHIDEYQLGYVIDIILNIRQELRAPYNKNQQDIGMTVLLSMKIQSDYSTKITRIRGVWYDVKNVLWQLHTAVKSEDDMNTLWEAFGEAYGERVNSFQGAAIAHRFLE